MDRRTEGQDDRRTGGQEDRRIVGQEERRTELTEKPDCEPPSPRNLIQKLLPTDFSVEDKSFHQEDFNEGL